MKLIQSCFKEIRFRNVFRNKKLNLNICTFDWIWYLKYTFGRKKTSEIKAFSTRQNLIKIMSYDESGFSIQIKIHSFSPIHDKSMKFYSLNCLINSPAIFKYVL